MAKHFVASAGPQGWKLGRWYAKSATAWEERKADGSTVAYQVATDGKKVAGSSTVVLRNATSEVIVLDRSVQVFTNGKWSGEYFGYWETPPPPGAPPPPPVPGYSMSNGGLDNAGGFNKSAPPGKSQQMKDPRSAPAAPGIPPPGQSASAIGATKHRKAPDCDKSPATVDALLAAVKGGDVDATKKLLDSKADPDATAKDGTSALMIAADKGKVKLVNALVEAGADVNIGGKDGNTPLTIAHAKGHTEVRRVLMAAAFQSLDSAVGSGKALDAAGNQNYGDEEVPESAMFELREVTSQLARLGKTEGEGSPARSTGGAAIQQATQGEDGEGHDSELMREEAVRDAMRTLLKVQQGDGN
eukprot:gnl/TRDRNA2_/TRDRNA2_61666_c0_seq1.p1 gnl/TRDRNA2_/TRDRNA2_61666_c0~~gnl/TRDRNA2_/TRDRNA2_61666_c0_seq1.p1  ORF type:complete len:358 (+),score=88.45 gnl/TRDRNA2_/TRDRNA2_61666_c0_seq1:43-1116(+)